jgi:hypothetical protein
VLDEVTADVAGVFDAISVAEFELVELFVAAGVAELGVDIVIGIEADVVIGVATGVTTGSAEANAAGVVEWVVGFDDEFEIVMGLTGVSTGGELGADMGDAQDGSAGMVGDAQEGVEEEEEEEEEAAAAAVAAFMLSNLFSNHW